jgi:hypothetical protein
LETVKACKNVDARQIAGKPTERQAAGKQYQANRKLRRQASGGDTDRETSGRKTVSS